MGIVFSSPLENYWSFSSCPSPAVSMQGEIRPIITLKLHHGFVPQCCRGAFPSCIRVALVIVCTKKHSSC